MLCELITIWELSKKQAAVTLKWTRLEPSQVWLLVNRTDPQPLLEVSFRTPTVKELPRHCRIATYSSRITKSSKERVESPFDTLQHRFMLITLLEARIKWLNQSLISNWNASRISIHELALSAVIRLTWSASERTEALQMPLPNLLPLPMLALNSSSDFASELYRSMISVKRRKISKLDT